jgi:hypothetical protein
MLGTDVRELVLDKDPIGQRAYDAVAKATKGRLSPSTLASRSRAQNNATKQSLETRIANQACGVGYFK